MPGLIARRCSRKVAVLRFRDVAHASQFMDVERQLAQRNVEWARSELVVPHALQSPYGQPWNKRIVIRSVDAIGSAYVAARLLGRGTVMQQTPTRLCVTFATNREAVAALLHWRKLELSYWADFERYERKSRDFDIEPPRRVPIARWAKNKAARRKWIIRNPDWTLPSWDIVVNVRMY
jgi:hypothetical protein